MCEPTEVDVHTLGDGALQALVVELQQQADRLEAARLRVLGEWDARAVWALDGACNGAAWLAARGNVARGPTATLLRDARHLRSMPETAAALAEGRLAPATARLMARVLNERTERAQERSTWAASSTPSPATASTSSFSSRASAAAVRSLRARAIRRAVAGARVPEANASDVSGSERRWRASRSIPAVGPRATSPRPASHDAPVQAPSRAHTARASHSPSTARRVASSRAAWSCSSTTSARRAASPS